MVVGLSRRSEVRGHRFEGRLRLYVAHTYAFFYGYAARMIALYEQKYACVQFASASMTPCFSDAPNPSEHKVRCSGWFCGKIHHGDTNLAQALILYHSVTDSSREKSPAHVTDVFTTD